MTRMEELRIPVDKFLKLDVCHSIQRIKLQFTPMVCTSWRFLQAKTREFTRNRTHADIVM